MGEGVGLRPAPSLYLPERKHFTPEDVLTHVTLYWVTGTISSSFGPYYEQATGARAGGSGRLEVPTGVSIFPEDPVPAPRAFVERFFAVRRCTEVPRGGHFGAWEEPELFAEDLRAFLASVR